MKRGRRDWNKMGERRKRIHGYIKDANDRCKWYEFNYKLSHLSIWFSLLFFFPICFGLKWSAKNRERKEKKSSFISCCNLSFISNVHGTVNNLISLPPFSSSSSLSIYIFFSSNSNKNGLIAIIQLLPFRFRVKGPASPPCTYSTVIMAELFGNTFDKQATPLSAVRSSAIIRLYQ